MNEITLRAAVDTDYDFAYEVKKTALGPYITEVWGWDEEEQRAYHQREFSTENLSVIRIDEHDVGLLNVVRGDQEILLHQIFIVPTYQRRGIGTHIMSQILEEADQKGVPVKLNFFKVNPVRDFYDRLGFVVVGENERSYMMERTV